MNLNQYIEQIETALKENTKCVTGILITNRAFARVQGKGNQPELLCLLYADLYACYIWGSCLFP